MVMYSEHVYARCLVITTQDSPIRSAVAELLAALKGYYDKEPLRAEEIRLEHLFQERDEVAQRSHAQLVRNLVSAPLVILDMNFAEASYYIAGIRQSLSNNPLIMLGKGADLPGFANSRFLAEPSEIIDVTQEGWLERALRASRAIGRPQEARWQNDLQATQAFAVQMKEVPFETSGLHETAWRASLGAGSWQGPELTVWRYRIQDAKGYDVWVNPENVYMEMARFWERSISAQIRKMGAVRRGSLTEHRRKDSLGLALAEKMGTNATVPVGTVFVTPTDPASSLYDKGVELVCHVASTIPDEERGGFRAAGQLDLSVRNVFRQLARMQPRGRRGGKKRSVLFPLIGSGDGGASPALVAHQMVSCLSDLVRNPANLTNEYGLSGIERIGLIAYTRSHLGYIVRELEGSGLTAVAPGE